METKKRKLHHEEKILDVPVWGTCEECEETEHHIEMIDVEESVEWTCIKCGYIEWLVKGD